MKHVALGKLNTIELERLVTLELSKQNISKVNSQRIQKQLHIIKEHDLETYRHSLRVGLRASAIGTALECRTKPLLIAGLLHDFGKTSVNTEILNKKEGFCSKDYNLVKKHVLAGYHFLEKDFPFSAEVFVRHHRSGEKPYPTKIPPIKEYLRESLSEIRKLSSLLSIIDYYDASVTRNNDRNGGLKLSSDDVRRNILGHYPKQLKMIEELYERNLLK